MKNKVPIIDSHQRKKISSQGLKSLRAKINKSPALASSSRCFVAELMSLKSGLDHPDAIRNAAANVGGYASATDLRASFLIWACILPYRLASSFRINSSSLLGADTSAIPAPCIDLIWLSNRNLKVVMDSLSPWRRREYRCS